MKASRGDIPVNVGSKFTGVVVEKEEPAKGTPLYAFVPSCATLNAGTLSICMQPAFE